MQTYRIFIILPPGFENLALREIQEKCPLTEPTVLKGGIEADADLRWIEEAHVLLKIPVRILLRLTSFKVRDFPKLYNRMSKFNWNAYLSHPEPEWQITARESRLLHTGKIEETLREALAEGLRRQPLSLDWKKKNLPRQTFYVRLQQDELTLSLDLTGEPLYKRGLQKIKGEAPLRENFAAAMLLELFRGVTEDIHLIDPMCGSATILTEALNFHRPLHLRPFAFESAPFYRGKVLKVEKLCPPLPLARASGMDLDAGLLSKVRDELKGEKKIALKAGDSLEEDLSGARVFMALNPPYGDRIRIEGKKGKFLQRALEKFTQKDKPLRLAWVIPSDMDDLFSNLDGYGTIQKLPFKNGGLPVTLWVWERLSKS